MTYPYRIAGWLHAELFNRLRSEERGQGTVEYVALILLVAVVLAGVVTAAKGADLGGKQIGEMIVTKIKSATDTVVSK